MSFLKLKYNLGNFSMTQYVMPHTRPAYALGFVIINPLHMWLVIIYIQVKINEIINHSFVLSGRQSVSFNHSSDLRMNFCSVLLWSLGVSMRLQSRRKHEVIKMFCLPMEQSWVLLRRWAEIKICVNITVRNADKMNALAALAVK